MSISIVIVTYNSARSLPNLLESIITQVQKSTVEKVIIVDNNSSDKNILKRIVGKYKNRINIKAIYRLKNCGFASSSNLGASLATDKILFINPDTELCENAISSLEKHMAIQSANIVGGKLVKFNQSGFHRTVYNPVTISTMILEFCNIGKIFNIPNNFYIDQSLVKVDAIVGGIGAGYMLVDVNSFRKLNGFDENYFMYLEDVDLCKRALEMKMKIVYCPHSVIKHIGGASSQNKHKIFHEAWYNSREYFAVKHFNPITAKIISIIYKVERWILEYREKHIS